MKNYQKLLAMLSLSTLIGYGCIPPGATIQPPPPVNSLLAQFGLDGLDVDAEDLQSQDGTQYGGTQFSLDLGPDFFFPRAVSTGGQPPAGSGKAKPVTSSSASGLHNFDLFHILQESQVSRDAEIRAINRIDRAEFDIYQKDGSSKKKLLSKAFPRAQLYCREYVKLAVGKYDVELRLYDNSEPKDMLFQETKEMTIEQGKVAEALFKFTAYTQRVDVDKNEKLVQRPWGYLKLGIKVETRPSLLSAHVGVYPGTNGDFAVHLDKFYPSGAAKKLSVDWGDGSKPEEKTCDNSKCTGDHKTIMLSHKYPEKEQDVTYKVKAQLISNNTSLDAGAVYEWSNVKVQGTASINQFLGNH